MTRRRRITWFACGFAGFALAVWLGPAGYWRCVGWWRGEALYKDRPVSWWRGELARWAPLDMGNEGFFQGWFPGHWREYPPAWEARLAQVSERLGLERVLPRRLRPRSDWRLHLGLPPWMTEDPGLIPVLVALLRDPDARESAVWGLRRMGEKAKPAVPVLLSLRDDPDLREHIYRAVKAIDPEAARATGVPDRAVSPPEAP